MAKKAHTHRIPRMIGARWADWRIPHEKPWITHTKTVRVYFHRKTTVASEKRRERVPHQSFFCLFVVLFSLSRSSCCCHQRSITVSRLLSTRRTMRTCCVCVVLHSFRPHLSILKDSYKVRRCDRSARAHIHTRSLDENRMLALPRNCLVWPFIVFVMAFGANAATVPIFLLFFHIFVFVLIFWNVMHRNAYNCFYNCFFGN